MFNPNCKIRILYIVKVAFVDGDFAQVSGELVHFSIVQTEIVDRRLLNVAHIDQNTFFAFFLGRGVEIGHCERKIAAL